MTVVWKLKIWWKKPQTFVHRLVLVWKCLDVHRWIFEHLFELKTVYRRTFTEQKEIKLRKRCGFRTWRLNSFSLQSSLPWSSSSSSQFVVASTVENNSWTFLRPRLYMFVVLLLLWFLNYHAMFLLRLYLLKLVLYRPCMNVQHFANTFIACTDNDSCEPLFGTDMNALVCCLGRSWLLANCYDGDDHWRGYSIVYPVHKFNWIWSDLVSIVTIVP